MSEMLRVGDRASFDRLVEPHRGDLHAHCYRMLGSLHDADDALQETLLGAWKGWTGFEGRGSLRSWLYTIATNACLRMLQGRRRRELPSGGGASHDPLEPLGEPLAESVWIDPYPDELLRYEVRESVELAYVAALQVLPPNQRAALLLCEVLAFTAREAASILDTSAAAVNSALQRARSTLARELPARSQQQTRRALGDERARELVSRFVDAWRRADIDAIVAMLAEQATFSMPPLPTWYRGRDDIASFLSGQVFQWDWRFQITSASGQPAMVAYRGERGSGRYALEALNVFTFDGTRISAITAFLDRAVLARVRLSPAPDR